MNFFNLVTSLVNPELGIWNVSPEGFCEQEPTGYELMFDTG